MATQTETVEYLFRTRGLDGVAQELEKTAKSADKAGKEVGRLKSEVDRLKRAQAGAAQASRRMSDGIRAAEGAGRVFGGRVGELAGILGDLEAVAAGSSGALGPAGIAGAFALLAAVAVPAAIVGTLSALVDLSRASVAAREELEKLGGLSLVSAEGLAGVEALEESIDRLDAQFSRLLVELSPALVPVIDMITNAIARMAGAAAVAASYLGGIDPTALGAGLGTLASVVGGIVLGGPGGGILAGLAGSKGGAALTAPVDFELGGRTLADVVADVKAQGQAEEKALSGIRFDRGAEFKMYAERFGMVSGGQDATKGIAFDTGAKFRAAVKELEISAIEFTGALGGTFEPLQSLADSAAALAVSLPRDVGAAIGGILARFGTGEAGGARLGQDIVSGLLAEIPIIGGFLSEILGILLDLPGFVDGLVSFVAEAPGRILSGIATVIADLPGKLIGEFLPALISGVIEGLAMLLVSPIALIEGLIAGIGRLPVALAEALVGLPVRILSFLDPDKNGLFRGSQGRILGIPGTEKKRDRTPVSAGRSADFDPNYTSKIGTGGTSEAAAFSSGGQTVLVGAWAEAVDSLGVAMRTRQAFGGGNVGP